ncbi:MAG TPA: helix-turn-helix domain-containing protein [Gemmatimonadaceae bacterium]|jgi:AraC-like DNA-binding protein|nr:helix-turn-helix domain-containing protein [Gemmatimonadaceae bacterium]
MLFESESTTFTEFVREERLTRARSKLLSPRFAARRIAEIAYEVGFNDLSYFNRSFRRRFGHSPSEVREMRRSDHC